MKTELRALNPINQKRKAIERGASSESVNKKKLAPTSPKSHSAGHVEPYGKCRRTNHITIECRVGTNKCIGVEVRSNSLLHVPHD